MKLHGLKVVSFESRRAKEMAELIRRYGGEPIVAPSLREVPLSENHAALQFLPELEAAKFDLLILMTGVGTRTLCQVLLTVYPPERILAALKRIQLVARGPKPVAALKEIGLAPAITVPEPHTWREVLGALDGAVALPGKRIAVQEYGIANADFVSGLESRGAVVKTISVYRWALPEDLAPLRAAIQRIICGDVDVALFTNGAQVEHLFRVAAEDSAGEKVRAAFERIVISSVGPICTQVLQRHGVSSDMEPDHPKMGSLLAKVAETARSVLATKRSVQP